MSTKTIALNSGVYERLSGAKREAESFSQTIARLLDTAGSAHAGRDVLAGLPAMKPLSEAEAGRMLQVVRENRTETWDRE